MGELYQLVPRRMCTVTQDQTFLNGYSGAVNSDGTLTWNGVVLDSGRPQRIRGAWLQWCPSAPEGQEVARREEITEHVPVQDVGLMVLGGLEVLRGVPTAGHTYNFRQGLWHENTPLSVNRDEAAIAQYDNKVYVLGGNDSSGPMRNILKSVEVYDVVSDAWSSLAPMQEARERAAAVHVQSGLYVCGGASSDHMLTPSAEVYHTSGWERIADLPTPRSGLGLVALGSKLFACGGESEWRTQDTVEIYDIPREVWLDGPPMLQPRANFGIAVLGRCIFVAGGSEQLPAKRTGERRRLASMERFDERIGNWRQCAPMLTARSFVSLTVKDSLIYAVGGCNDGPVADVETYDPRTDNWAPAPPLPTRRYGHGSVLVRTCRFLADPPSKRSSNCS